MSWQKNNIVTLYIVVTLLPCFLFYNVPTLHYLHLGFGVRSSFSVWELNWKPHLSYSEGEILAQHNTSWLSIKVITNTNNIYSNGKTKERWQKTISSTEILGHSWLCDKYREWFVGLVIHKVHKPSYILETFGTLVTLKVEKAYMWFMISTLISLLFEMMLFCLPLLISWV